MNATKTVLLVHAHPDSRSLTRELTTTARRALEDEGHHVLESDLYGQRWKAVFDADDFPSRAKSDRLSFLEESGHAFSNGLQTPDVDEEQRKLFAADAVVFQFPLWWFSVPAILKGWIDRVFANQLAYGFKGQGNRYRYGDGGFAGKRAMLSVTVGGPAIDYGPRGINGPLDQLLFPLTHGTLFFAGFAVLPTFALYGVGGLDEAGVARAEDALTLRMQRLFVEEPIPFRSQNGGDYPDGHTLAPEVDAEAIGIDAHLATST